MICFICSNYIDETVIYFDDDPKEYEHYLGYIPEIGKTKPYWIGYCDINGGYNFKTAKELFEAKVFNGKSVKERWEHVVVYQIDGWNSEDFMEMYGEEFLNNRRTADKK